jgi:hypothetical protein
MQGDDEACQEFIIEWHDDATADLGAMCHIANESVGEGLSNVNGNCDLCEHAEILHDELHK